VIVNFIFEVPVRFATVLKYRNKLKEVIIFFRKKYRNRTETEFRLVSVRTERKKIRFAGLPSAKGQRILSLALIGSLSSTAQLGCQSIQVKKGGYLKGGEPSGSHYSTLAA
jgi:hypothetical protein